MSPLSTLTPAEKLLYLQDLDLLLKDAGDEGTREVWHQAQLKISGLQQLLQVRADVAAAISPRLLEVYERIFRRYGRALAPVRNGTCLGCFAKLPTGASPQAADAAEISTCESCGRMLYWI